MPVHISASHIEAPRRWAAALDLDEGLVCGLVVTVTWNARHGVSFHRNRVALSD